MNLKEISLPVTGMTCAMCVNNVERSLRKADGVDEVQVNLATEKAAVQYDASKLQMRDLVLQIEKSGYGVATASIDLPITGMTCAMCQKNVARALNKVEGVIDVAVNLSNERATVGYMPGALRRGDLVNAVENAGYGVIELGSEENAEDAEAARPSSGNRSADASGLDRRLFHRAIDRAQHVAALHASSALYHGSLALAEARSLAFCLWRAGNAGRIDPGTAIPARRC